MPTPPLVPYVNRAVLPPAVACEFLGVGKTKLYELFAAGDLASVKRGSRRYVFTDSVLALVESWRAQAGGNDHAN